LRLTSSSFTSVTVQRAFLVGFTIPPRRLWDGAARHRSRSRSWNGVPRGNELSRTDCGFLRPSCTARRRAGSTTTQRPRKAPRTAREATNYDAPNGIAVRATRGSRRRPGPTDYEVCPILLQDRSITSVTVQWAFLGGGGIPPCRLGDGGARQRSRPRGRNRVPRRNEPSRTDCGALGPSYTARHRAGLTTTYRTRKVPRPAREATK
jgi:hypothetical protein